jgi:1-acyl-sn-glycerol-3-phosphate acyltransferase
VSALRKLWRMPLFAALTGLAFLVWVATTWLLWPAPRLRERHKRAIMRGWGRAGCAALGVRVERAGPLPRGSGVLAANHLGYLDVLVLASLLPVVFVAKADVRRWPVLGSLAACFDTLFLERENKRTIPRVNDRIRESVARGRLVAVFPEATSTAGAEVLPFKPSILAPAAEGGLDVWTATLGYETGRGDPPARKAVCWWGDAAFGPHLLKLFGLSRIRARVTFGPSAVRHGDRKELARILWEQVRGAFTPVR